MIVKVPQAKSQLSKLTFDASGLCRLW